MLVNREILKEHERLIGEIIDGKKSIKQVAEETGLPEAVVSKYIKNYVLYGNGSLSERHRGVLSGVWEYLPLGMDRWSEAKFRLACSLLSLFVIVSGVLVMISGALLVPPASNAKAVPPFEERFEGALKKEDRSTMLKQIKTAEELYSRLEKSLAGSGAAETLTKYLASRRELISRYKLGMLKEGLTAVGKEKEMNSVPAVSQAAKELFRSASVVSSQTDSGSGKNATAQKETREDGGLSRTDVADVAAGKKDIKKTPPRMEEIPKPSAGRIEQKENTEARPENMSSCKNESVGENLKNVRCAAPEALKVKKEKTGEGSFKEASSGLKKTSKVASQSQMNAGRETQKEVKCVSTTAAVSASISPVSSATSAGGVAKKNNSSPENSVQQVKQCENPTASNEELERIRREKLDEARERYRMKFALERARACEPVSEKKSSPAVSCEKKQAGTEKEESISPILEEAMKRNISSGFNEKLKIDKPALAPTI